MSFLWDASTEPGTCYRTCLAEQLTRQHIAEYAGASGDFNLMHTDERFAVEQAGRPSVIAHGMLTMGLTATFLTALVGKGTLKSFGGRFLAPVLPGQRLTSTVTVTSLTAGAGAPVASLQVTTNADDAAVFEGYAVAQRS
jgi:acyl dehydratase